MDDQRDEARAHRLDHGCSLAKEAEILGHENDGQSDEQNGETGGHPSECPREQKHATEEAELLEYHGPGDDGENPEQEQNATGNPASLSKNVTEIGDKNRSGQKNDTTPQLEINFPDLRNVAHAYRVVKQMRCGR